MGAPLVDIISSLNYTEKVCVAVYLLFCVCLPLIRFFLIGYKNEEKYEKLFFEIFLLILLKAPVVAAIVLIIP